MPIRKRARDSLILFLVCLLAWTGFESSASAQSAVYPCSVGPANIPGLVFTNPGSSANPDVSNTYVPVGALTVANINASNACGGILLGTSLRPLDLSGNAESNLGVKVVGATSAGGWLIRFAVDEVRYLPPSAAFSGTDTFRIDNGNQTTRIINVTVNVLAGSDTTPPAAPVITAPGNGASLADTTPTFTGSAEVMSTVKVYIDGSAVGTTTADGGGGWSFTPGAALASGAHNAYATATDAANNTSPNSATISFTIVSAPTAGNASATVAYGSTNNIMPLVLGGGATTSVAVATPATNGTATATGTSITYTPNAGYAGLDSFTYTATNAAGTSSPATVTITVSPPTITLTPAAGALPGSAAGSAYSQTFSASGGATPYSYGITSGALPPGLSLNGSTGLVSGTPTTAGTFNFTMTATDVNGFTASSAYSITVAVPTLTIDGTLPGSAVGQAYNQTLTASGGVAPYTFTLQAGALPAGLSLSTGGTLSGTPTLSGSFNLTIRATDSTAGAGPAFVDRSFTLVIATPTISVAPTALGTISFGTPYSASITASGGTAPYSYAVSAGALPAGLALSSAGVLSGTPTAQGSFSFTVVATDSLGNASAPATVTITVSNPVVTVGPASLAAGQQDVAYTAALAASGGTAPYSFAVTGGALPVGLTLATDGTLSGTPTENGSFAFTVTATDSSAGTGPFSGATAYALQIALPAPPVARDAPDTSVPGATVQNNRSVDIDLAALVDGNYTEIRIDTQPQHGTVTIASGGQAPAGIGGMAATSRYVATYRPAVGYQGADDFTFVAVGPGGSSTPAHVAITVVGVVPVARSFSTSLLNGREVMLDITTGTAEGPFTSAAIVSVTPADALSAELVAGGTADNRSYALKLKALGRFSGSAAVRYTLSNVFGASEPATVTATVEARPDPSKDPVVRALSAAQAEATRRFASTQLDNFARRNEQLHGGGGASRGKQFGMRVSGGDPVDIRAEAEKNELDMRALRGVQMADASSGASPVIAKLAAAEEDISPSGDRRIGSVELWTGGALLIGTRDATTGRSRLRVSSSGLSAGLDLKVSTALTLGIGGGYGFDRTKVGQDGQGRLDGENWAGVLYGSLTPMAGMFVDGAIGVGGLDFETRREVEANGTIAHGQRDGSMVFGSLATGFDRSGDRWRFSGYGRFEYMVARLDAYAERGADIYNLSFAEREPESFASILGARGASVLPASIGLFTPRGRIEWRHEFNRSGAQGLDYADIVGASGLGHGYLIDDDHWSRDEIQLEIGTGFEIGSGWLFGIDVGGRFGSGTAVGTAKVGASKRF